VTAGQVWDACAQLILEPYELNWEVQAVTKAALMLREASKVPMRDLPENIPNASYLVRN
jgi:hypothetical protein